MAKNHFPRAENDSQCVLKEGIFIEKWTQNFDLGTGRNAIFGLYFQQEFCSRGGGLFTIMAFC